MAVKGQQRYRVVQRLAAGGMAEVFLAESAGLEGFKKKVAIKRVLPHLSEKKRFISMFLDEARLSAQFNHSNVAHVFDIGVGDNAYFIVMEYVEGTDLRTLMTNLVDQRRPVPLEAALYITERLCEGLAYAHELTGLDGKPLNAVHRDMSPPNVLISKFGEVKIVDFGLAKASTQLEKSEPGIVKGKFSYLAPEAAHGMDVDARADIFAVGVMLWEMLAGRKLFEGSTDLDTVRLIQAAEVPRIASFNPLAADPDVEAILSRALARDRDRRYQSARELGRDLTKLLFRMAQPVDAFDIADLVRVTTAVEEPAAAVAGMETLDKLIDDTLLRFTSLRERGASQTSAMASIAPPSMETPSASVRRLEHSSSDSPVEHSIPASALREGNLSALEDVVEAPSISPRAASTVAKRPGVDPGLLSGLASMEQPTLRPPEAPQLPEEPLPLVVTSKKPAAQPASDDAASGGSLALKLILLVLIAAGAGAAAYFSGLL
ncbi:MAG: serine/threonine protein kinase [Deltaproteobacteria bacterium]|nr:serine/threonine protein kinase [Deltaproteobacteria bacterium]